MLEKLLEYGESHGIGREDLIGLIQNKYRTCIGLRRLDMLKVLEDITGVKPSEEIVQEGIREYVVNGWMIFLESLIEKTGIQPQLSEDIVQRSYTNLVVNGRIDYLKRLMEITGIEPKLPEKVVQKGYRTILDGIEEWGLKELKEITGIQPNLPNGIVQKKYRDKVKDGYVNRVGILIEGTGILPSEKIVQQGFRIYWEKGKLKEIKELSEVTGINPKISESDVQERCKVYIKQGRLEDLRLLMEITGIQPSNEAYNMFLKYLINFKI